MKETAKIVAMFTLKWTLILVAALVLLLGTILMYLSQNDAEKVTRPFKQALEKAGATQLCDNGDGGHFLNDQPWYDIVYDIPLSRDRTLELIKKVGENKGYTIKQASLDDRGYVDVSDDYLDDNYFASALPQKGLVGNIVFRFYKGASCYSGAKSKGEGFTQVILHVDHPRLN